MQWIVKHLLIQRQASVVSQLSQRLYFLLPMDHNDFIGKIDTNNMTQNLEVID